MRPIIKDPVSPMKICAGVKLYLKNATTAPAVAKATMANSMAPVMKNQQPKVVMIRVPILPARPLIPSTKLNALVMSKIVSEVMMALSHSGKSALNPPTPYKVLNVIPDLKIRIKAARS